MVFHHSLSIETIAYETSENYWAEGSKLYFGFVVLNILILRGKWVWYSGGKGEKAILQIRTLQKL